MKTILATQKSEYSHCLMQYISQCTDRVEAYYRMKEIEQKVKDLGDEIRIVITTKNTDNIYSANAMSLKDIKKNKDL